MIHICIHSLPEEIDQLEQLLILLKRNSIYLPENHGIKVEVYLNGSLVNWNESILDWQFFITKLGYLDDLTESWAETDFNYGCEEGVIKGCNDLRRCVIRSTNKPFVMYLDTDNLFDDHFLAYMYNCIGWNEDNYRIFTPQTTRMWDATWDCITNKYCLNDHASHKDYSNRDGYYAVAKRTDSNRSLKLIDGFKFAGWGTTINTKLARLINIPDSLGSYGLDDTFIMHGCQILKDKGYDVKQYVIENQIIIENNKFRYNPYKNYITGEDRREEFLKQAEANFNPELQKLHARITTQK